MNCCEKLCAFIHVLSRESKPTLKHVQIEWKKKSSKIFRLLKVHLKIWNLDLWRPFRYHLLWETSKQYIWSKKSSNRFQYWLLQSQKLKLFLEPIMTNRTLSGSSKPKTNIKKKKNRAFWGFCSWVHNISRLFFRPIVRQYRLLWDGGVKGFVSSRSICWLAKWMLAPGHRKDKSNANHTLKKAHSWIYKCHQPSKYSPKGRVNL